MNAELISLREKRGNLEEELAMLSRREKALRVRAELLEGRLRNRGIDASKSAVRIQTATGTGRTATGEHGAQLSRVRLKRNAVFSWSYTKLP